MPPAKLWQWIRTSAEPQTAFRGLRACCNGPGSSVPLRACERPAQHVARGEARCAPAGPPAVWPALARAAPEGEVLPSSIPRGQTFQRKTNMTARRRILCPQDKKPWRSGTCPSTSASRTRCLRLTRKLQTSSRTLMSAPGCGCKSSTTRCRALNPTAARRRWTRHRRVAAPLIRSKPTRQLRVSRCYV